MNAKCVAIFVDFCKAFYSVSWAQMEAILYAYQVPSDLVLAIMSVYHGAKAGVLNSDGQLEDDNTFNLNTGVLQGDTLAPYLFVIVMDFVMRSAIREELGIVLNHESGTDRTFQPTRYLTDLDFADDIILLAPTIRNAQRLLSNLEKWALKVGLRINQKKTEFILVGDWISKNLHTISTRDGPLKRVDDYKYLGSWLLNSDKDFRVRKELAWKAAKSLYRIW